jgi:SAM-dependent methyltransferase
VNFYPLGTELAGTGQIAMTESEVYWRQDAATDPELRSKFFEVDACMRGPLFIRRDFLVKHGYLDEAYAPLYMDDMDLCFRVRDRGSKVYCMLSNVENESLTMANYDAGKWAYFEKVIKKNTKLFYERWLPSMTKDYLRVERVPLSGGRVRKPIATRVRQSRGVARQLQRLRLMSRVLDVRYCRELSDSLWQRRLAWVREQAAAVPEGRTVLDIGAGSAPYRSDFAHTNYMTQDLMQTPALEYGRIDIVSDLTDIPLPDGSADVVLCTEVFEHVPEPLAALSELVRLMKPGGTLIFTAPLGSGHHQKPYQFYGGYTRFWYEKFFPEHGLEIVSLEPNGGLYAHTAELLWRGRDEVINPLRDGSALKKVIAGVLQVLVFNLPTLVLHTVERRRLDEDFTVGFHCVARRKVEGSQPQP